MTIVVVLVTISLRVVMAGQLCELIIKDVSGLRGAWSLSESDSPHEAACESSGALTEEKA